MIRVRCQQQVTIDAKGRLALPAPIRRFLEEAGETSLVLTFARDSVWAWTVSHYEEKVERPMLERDPFKDDVLDFAHSIMSTAQDCEIDKQGRIRIPPRLRELANLSKDCIVHALLGRLEIWDLETWGQRFEESRSRAPSGLPSAGE